MSPKITFLEINGKNKTKMRNNKVYAKIVLLDLATKKINISIDKNEV